MLLLGCCEHPRSKIHGKFANREGKLGTSSPSWCYSKSWGYPRGKCSRSSCNRINARQWHRQCFTHSLHICCNLQLELAKVLHREQWTARGNNRSSPLLSLTGIKYGIVPFSLRNTTFLYGQTISLSSSFYWELFLVIATLKGYVLHKVNGVKWSKRLIKFNKTKVESPY